MDDVQTQLVLLDDTVDSFVSRASDRLSRILNRTAVAHLDQKLDDEPFEKCEILHQYDIQQFGRQFIVYLFVGVGDRLFRSDGRRAFRIDSRRALVFPRLVVAGRRGVEIDEIRVSRQVGYIYFLFGF